MPPAHADPTGDTSPHDPGPEVSGPVTSTPTGRAVTADGVGVAYYDLGGTGPVLLLVHATGFCAAVLAPLAARLTERFRCIAIDERAHGASDRPPSGDFGWHGFAADVLAVVDHLHLVRPAGFGHSSGAAALLLAEQARPGTFATLYCYEPIVRPDDIPLAPSVDANPLSFRARRRRELFASRQDALANFSAKTPFDRLDPGALAAYVDNGFAPDPDGIRLRCHREDEAQVYAHSFSHDAFAHLHQVRCPVALVCGAETDVIGSDILRLLAGRLAGPRVEVIRGLGHLGPLESPETVAQSLMSSMVGTGIVDQRDTPEA